MASFTDGQGDTMGDLADDLKNSTQLTSSVPTPANIIGANSQQLVMASRNFFLRITYIATILAWMKLGPDNFRLQVLALSSMTACFRTRDSLHLLVNGVEQWALSDSGSSGSYMTVDKANDLGLKIQWRPEGRLVPVRIPPGEVIYSVGTVNAQIHIIGMPGLPTRQKFIVLPQCTRPLIIGFPYLEKTGTLQKTNRYRVQAPPVLTMENSDGRGQRIEIQLLNNALARRAYAIRDTASGVNCMPKAVADEMKYAINTRWWHRRWLRNAAGHLFRTEGIVKEKVKIGSHAEEHTIVWDVVKRIDVHVLGQKFVDHHGLFEDRYASAMIHDVAPKVHELYILRKDYSLTAWVRRGWRKLRGKRHLTSGQSLTPMDEMWIRLNEERTEVVAPNNNQPLEHNAHDQEQQPTQPKASGALSSPEQVSGTHDGMARNSDGPSKSPTTLPGSPAQDTGDLVHSKVTPLNPSTPPHRPQDTATETDISASQDNSTSPGATIQTTPTASTQGNHDNPSLSQTDTPTIQAEQSLDIPKTTNLPLNQEPVIDATQATEIFAAGAGNNLSPKSADETSLTAYTSNETELAPPNFHDSTHDTSVRRSLEEGKEHVSPEVRPSPPSIFPMNTTTSIITPSTLNNKDPSMNQGTF